MDQLATTDALFIQTRKGEMIFDNRMTLDELLTIYTLRSSWQYELSPNLDAHYHVVSNHQDSLYFDYGCHVSEPPKCHLLPRPRKQFKHVTRMRISIDERFKSHIEE
jgi:hypothetical protein